MSQDTFVRRIAEYDDYTHDDVDEVQILHALQHEAQQILMTDPLTSNLVPKAWKCRHCGRKNGAPNLQCIRCKAARCTCRHDTSNGAGHADECPVERRLCGELP